MTYCKHNHDATPIAYRTWDEDTTPVSRNLYLDAASYGHDTIFDIPPARWDEGGAYLVSPQGAFGYQNRVVPQGTPLGLYGEPPGRVIWNCDVTVPTLIDMNRRRCSGEFFPRGTPDAERVKYGAVWMALTPMEMMTQRGGVRMASGKVVIGGLGLGWLLRKVCEKPEVERVIVVDRSRELLDWFGHRLCRRHPKVSDVICDDIYHQIGKHGLAARYLLDIWPTYAGAAHDDRLARVRRGLKRRLWAWGLD